MYSITGLGRYPLESRAFIPAKRLNGSVMSRTVPRCSCHGELTITGEIRSPDGWRTGFNLQCKQCGKKWTYSGGVYRQESAENAGEDIRARCDGARNPQPSRRPSSIDARTRKAWPI